jgi:acyl-CoA thioesterase-2
MHNHVPPPSPALTAAQSIERLVALLDVESLGDDRFRGHSTEAGWQRVYGGQVIAQALMAASKTVPVDRPAHSLHAYFMRPGDPKEPIVYRVERDRDGASFSSRRIIALQYGKAIFSMSASFQVEETGLEHTTAMPAVVGPEGLMNELELHIANADHIPESHRALWLGRDRPIEFRPVEPGDPIKPEAGAPVAHNWFRTAATVPDIGAEAQPALARCLLAYASDMTLLDTCLLPHAIAWPDPALQAASLDHAMWFHTTPDLSQWHLFAQDSPRASGGRGINRGLVYADDGTLVATVMQEGLIRYRG